LGMCEMERGNADAAVGHFQQGLELPDLTPVARHALQYELGAAFETQGLGAEALEQYQAIHGEDPSFRDVAERVQRMGGDLQAASRPIARRPANPVSAPQKVAARSTAPPTSAGAPGPSPDPARKNRKIGIVLRTNYTTTNWARR